MQNFLQTVQLTDTLSGLLFVVPAFLLRLPRISHNSGLFSAFLGLILPVFKSERLEKLPMPLTRHGKPITGFSSSGGLLLVPTPGSTLLAHTHAFLRCLLSPALCSLVFLKNGPNLVSRSIYRQVRRCAKIAASHFLHSNFSYFFLLIIFKQNTHGYKRQENAYVGCHFGRCLFLLG